MQDFVIGIPKGSFSKTFFTDQYFRSYQFNGNFFLCQIKARLPGTVFSCEGLKGGQYLHVIEEKYIFELKKILEN